MIYGNMTKHKKADILKLYNTSAKLLNISPQHLFEL